MSEVQTNVLIKFVDDPWKLYSWRRLWGCTLEKVVQEDEWEGLLRDYGSVRELLWGAGGMGMRMGEE